MSHRHKPRVGGQQQLALINRLEVILDRARRKHLRRYYASVSPPSLDQTLATPDGKRRYVRTLFAAIADRYDFITIVLSYGRDRAWKARLVDLAAPAHGTRALDLATGTGDIAFAMQSRGAEVVGLDVTARMIALASAKSSRAITSMTAMTSGPLFLVGDMVALPFRAASFDLVTTGYGLRNDPISPRPSMKCCAC